MRNHPYTVVVGGTSGIGKSIAREFTRQARTLIVTGTKLLSDEGMHCDSRTFYRSLDILSALERKSFCASFSNAWIEALVLVVGGGKFCPLLSAPENYVDDVLSLNLSAPLQLLQGLVPRIVPGGSIVLLGSAVSTMGVPGASVYAAAKAGLVAVAKSLSNELAEAKVRVNVVSPGLIATPIYKKLGLNFRSICAEVEPRISARCTGVPSDVANVVSFLCQESSRYINGSEILVDGGMRVRM